MSRRKKKKKYYQQSAGGISGSNVSSVASTAVAGFSSVSSSMARPSPVSAPQIDKQAPIYNAHEEEYRMVRSDLIRVAIVNGLFLAAVVALYFVNKSHPFLEVWYKKLF